MRTIRPYRRELYVPLELKTAGKLESLVDGDMAIHNPHSRDIFAAATDTDRLQISRKINGRFLQSEPFLRGDIRNARFIDYGAPQSEIHEATVTECAVSNIIEFQIGVRDDSLIKDYGSNAINDVADTFIQVRPSELKECEDVPKDSPYINNILSELLFNKANDRVVASPYYTVELVRDYDSAYRGDNLSQADFDSDTSVEVFDVDDSANSLNLASTGNVRYIWDATPTLGADGVTERIGNQHSLRNYIASRRAGNTDADSSNHGPLFKIVITGKDTDAATYNDLELDYTYPRGVNLEPIIRLIDGSQEEETIDFERIQDLKYSQGSGVDLKRLEHETASGVIAGLHWRVGDGTLHPNIRYQTNDAGKYNLIDFEYLTNMSYESGTGDRSATDVVIGIDSTLTNAATMFTALKTILGLGNSNDINHADYNP